MARMITLKIDLDTLPAVITKSASTCLTAHGIRFEEDGRTLTLDEWKVRMYELGNNVAQMLALFADEEK